jgi:hypothetical protein
MLEELENLWDEMEKEIRAERERRLKELHDRVDAERKTFVDEARRDGAAMRERLLAEMRQAVAVERSRRIDEMSQEIAIERSRRMAEIDQDLARHQRELDEIAAEQERLLLEARDETVVQRGRLDAVELELAQRQRDLDDVAAERERQLADVRQEVDAERSRLDEIGEERARHQQELDEIVVERERQRAEAAEEAAAQRSRLDEADQELARRQGDLEVHLREVGERKQELLDQVRYEVAAERDLLLRASETEAERLRLTKVEEVRAHVRELVQEAADDIAEMRSRADAESAGARAQIEQARDALRGDRALLRQQLAHLLDHARQLALGDEEIRMEEGVQNQGAREIEAPRQGLSTQTTVRTVGRLLPPEEGADAAISIDGGETPQAPSTDPDQVFKDQDGESEEPSDPDQAS